MRPFRRGWREPWRIPPAPGSRRIGLTTSPNLWKTQPDAPKTSHQAPTHGRPGRMTNQQPEPVENQAGCPDDQPAASETSPSPTCGRPDTKHPAPGLRRQTPPPSPPPDQHMPKPAQPTPAGRRNSAAGTQPPGSGGLTRTPQRSLHYQTRGCWETPLRQPIIPCRIHWH